LYGEVCYKEVDIEASKPVSSTSIWCDAKPVFLGFVELSYLSILLTACGGSGLCAPSGLKCAPTYL